MRASVSAFKLIKQFEGCRLDAYQDVAGVWTIGYGWTGKVRGKTIGAGSKITPGEADELLKAAVSTFERGVDALLTRTVNQNQFDALVSLAYNIGLGALEKSTLLRYVNQGDFFQAACQFIAWNKAGGKPVYGLLRRRFAEGELFLS